MQVCSKALCFYKESASIWYYVSLCGGAHDAGVLERLFVFDIDVPCLNEKEVVTPQNTFFCMMPFALQISWKKMLLAHLVVRMMHTDGFID